MINKLDLSAVILTFNEEIHIKRCISSIKNLVKDIYVVDSFSSDKTVEFAKELGAKVYQNTWEKSYSKQFNWALNNISIDTRWILRLDADEYLSFELCEELREKLPNVSNDVSGIVLPLKRVFLNEEIKRSAGKSVKLLRIFRSGMGFCEDRWMDEHIQLLQGETIEFQFPFADHNLNLFSWWTEKHNGYSIREALDLLDIEYGIFGNQASNLTLTSQALLKRKKKLKYVKQPLFLRSFAYFIYRYFFKLGFLDGRAGFLWHFFQGWWYRTLVDVKIFEIKKACGNDPEKIKEFIFTNYRIKL